MSEVTLQMKAYMRELEFEKQRKEIELKKMKSDLKNIEKAFKSLTEKKRWWNFF